MNLQDSTLLNGFSDIRLEVPLKLLGELLLKRKPGATLPQHVAESKDWSVARLPGVIIKHVGLVRRLLNIILQLGIRSLFYIHSRYLAKGHHLLSRYCSETLTMCSALPRVGEGVCYLNLQNLI